MGITTHTDTEIKMKSASDLDYLPISGVLKNGRQVQLELLDRNNKKDIEEMRLNLNDIAEEGIHYPFYNLDQEGLEKYFLVGEVFLLKYVDSGDLIGSFYIKSFFPDRAAHICNAGFGVKKDQRGQGALQFMIKAYLKLSRDLGYLASYFTMVFAVNESALKVYHKMGFQQVGCIPKCGNLKGLGLVDAYQFYYDLTTLGLDGCPVGGWTVE